MVNREELIGFTVYLTLETRCSINRLSYKQGSFYLFTKSFEKSYVCNSRSQDRARACDFH